MSKINWGGGLKRLFIAFSALWFLGAAVVFFTGGNDYRTPMMTVPDSTWNLYDLKARDGTLYTVYASTSEDAETQLLNTEGASASSPDPYAGIADVVGKPQFDPSTAKPITVVLSQGETYNFPDKTTPAVIKTAITRHFKEENSDIAKKRWRRRFNYLMGFLIAYGVICAIIFSIRWIVGGFKPTQG